MSGSRRIESKAKNPYHIDLELAKLGYRFPKAAPRTISDIAKKDERFQEAKKQIEFLRRLEKDISGVVLYSKTFPYIAIDGGENVFNEIMAINGNVLSALRSVGTICDCLNTGHFSDAYVLLRRFRDDLFFYIYLLVGSKCDSLHKSSLWTDAAKRWFSNNRSGFYPYQSIQSLLGMPDRSDRAQVAMTAEYDCKNEIDSLFVQGEEKLKEAIQEFATRFELAEKNKQYNRILNGSVHGNGSELQNVNLQLFDYMRCVETLLQQISGAYEMTGFFVLLFLSLLAIIRPGSLTANDYVNACDNQEVPEEGTQYYVCPALIPYLRRGDEIVGAGFYSELKDLSQMKEMASPISAYEVKVPDKIKAKLDGKRLQLTQPNGETEEMELKW